MARREEETKEFEERVVQSTVLLKLLKVVVVSVSLH